LLTFPGYNHITVNIPAGKIMINTHLVTLLLARLIRWPGHSPPT